MQGVLRESLPGVTEGPWLGGEVARVVDTDTRHLGPQPGCPNTSCLNFPSYSWDGFVD